MWRIFREHHYLSANFNKAARFYVVYWNDVLVGMASVLPMPCGTIKYAYRQHRLVILPDYQGLGFGTKINDFLAKYYVSMGYKYFIRTTHLRLNNHLSKLRTWKSTSTSGKKRSIEDINNNIEKGCIKGDERIAGSFEYLGNDYANKQEKVIKVDNVEDIEKFKEYIKNLKDKYYIRVVTGKPQEDNEIEIAMKELGVRTEQLYYRKNGELIENGKYKKYKYFSFDK